MNKVMGKKRLLIALVVMLIIASISIIAYTKQHHKEEPVCVLLNAGVTLDNGKITITNNDSFDYVNTELVINNHYKLIGFNLIAGETSTLWQVEFSNYYRRRMKSNEKALTFSIVSKLYDGGKGVYYTQFSKK